MATRETEESSPLSKEDINQGQDDDFSWHVLSQSALPDSPRLEPIGLEDTGQGFYPHRSVVGQEQPQGIPNVTSRESTLSFHALPVDISNEVSGGIDNSQPLADQNEEEKQSSISESLWEKSSSEFLTQHPLESTDFENRPSAESDVQLSQYSLCTNVDQSTVISQHTLLETPREANRDLSAGSLARLQSVQEADLILECSQEHIFKIPEVAEETSEVVSEDKPQVACSSPTARSSGSESSDPIAMFSTRPGTAVDICEGEQEQSDVKSNGITGHEQCDNGTSSGMSSESIQADNVSGCPTEERNTKSLIDSCSFQTVNSTQFLPDSASTPQTLGTEVASGSKLDNTEQQEKVPKEEFAASEELGYPNLICHVAGSDSEGSDLISRASSKGSQDDIFIADSGLFTKVDQVPNRIEPGEISRDLTGNVRGTSSNDVQSENDVPSLKSDSVSSTPVDMAGILDVSCRTGDTDSLTAGYLEHVVSVGDVSSTHGGERSSFTTVTELELQSQPSFDEVLDNDGQQTGQGHGNHTEDSDQKSQNSETGEPEHRNHTGETQNGRENGKFVQVSSYADRIHEGNSIARNHVGDKDETYNDNKVISDIDKFKHTNGAMVSDGEEQKPTKESSLSNKVAALLAEVKVQTFDSGVGLGLTNGNNRELITPATKAEDSDYELKQIAEEYKQALKAHVASEESSTDMEDRSSLDNTDVKKLDGSIHKANVSDQSISVKSKSVSLRNDELKTSESETDDTLDQDVKRILAKYGRTLSDSEDEHGIKISSYCRGSATNSDVESDNISLRVKKLLCGKPGEKSDPLQSLMGSDSLPLYLFDDPAKSMSLPMELQSATSQASASPSTVSPRSVDYGADKSRSYGEAGSQHTMSENTDSEDQLSTKVRHVLKQGKYGTSDDVTSLSKGSVASKNSSRTGSVSGSVSLDDLGKDINEIEIVLENLKSISDKASVRSDQSNSECPSSSNVSPRQAQTSDILDRHTSAKSGPFSMEQAGYVQYTSQATETKRPPPKTSDYGKPDVSKTTDWHPSDQSIQQVVTGRSPVKYNVGGYVPKNKGKLDLGAHTLLTSGVIPLDLALDIVHGYDYPSISPGNNSFRKTGYPGYFSMETGHFGDQSSSSINSGKSPGYVSEYSAGMTKNKQFNVHSGPITGSKSNFGLYGSATDSKDATLTPKLPLKHQSPDLQSGTVDGLYVGGAAAKSPDQKNVFTPTAQGPISVLGNVKNLFTSHMDKVVLSAFDKSVELRTPCRHYLESNLGEKANMSGNLSAHEKFAESSTHTVSKPVTAWSGSQKTALSSQADPPYSLQANNESRCDITKSNASQGSLTSNRSTSPFILPENFKPYKPVSSQEVYYVESGTEDGLSTATLTESTTESTHLGSDDARAPRFPASVLGSRADNPNHTEGIYHKQKTGEEDAALSTIQEQPSFDSRDTDSGKSKSDDSSKHRKNEEKESSFLKAKDWVDSSFTGSRPWAVKSNDVKTKYEEHHQQKQQYDAVNVTSPEAHQYHETYHDNDTGAKIEMEFSTPKKCSNKSSCSRDRFGHSMQSVSDGSYLNSQNTFLQDEGKWMLSGTQRDSEGSFHLKQDYDTSLHDKKARDPHFLAASPHYDALAKKVDYGQLKYSQRTGEYELPSSFDSRSPLQENYNKMYDHEEFLPLEVDKDEECEDVPGKAYPATPHPNTAMSHSQDPVSPVRHLSPTSRLPTKYYFRDGSVICRSPDGSSVINRSQELGNRPPEECYRGSPSTTNKARSPTYRELSPLRSSAGPHTQQRTEYSIRKQLYGNLCESDGGTTEQRFLPGVASPDLDHNYQQSYLHSDRHCAELHRIENCESRQRQTVIDEEKLMQKMRCVMAQLDPAQFGVPNDINDKWERFQQTRSQSDMSSTGTRSLDVSSSCMRDQLLSGPNLHFDSSYNDKSWEQRNDTPPQGNNYEHRQSLNRDVDHHVKLQGSFTSGGKESYHPDEDYHKFAEDNHQRHLHKEDSNHDPGIHGYDVGVSASSSLYARNTVNYRQPTGNAESSSRDFYTTDTDSYSYDKHSKHKDSKTNRDQDLESYGRHDIEPYGNENKGQDFGIYSKKGHGQDHGPYNKKDHGQYPESYSSINRQDHDNYRNKDRDFEFETSSNGVYARSADAENEDTAQDKEQLTGSYDDGAKSHDGLENGSHKQKQEPNSRCQDQCIDSLQGTGYLQHSYGQLKDATVQVRTPDIMSNVGGHFTYNEPGVENLSKEKSSGAREITQPGSGKSENNTEPSVIYAVQAAGATGKDAAGEENQQSGSDRSQSAPTHTDGNDDRTLEQPSNGNPNQAGTPSGQASGNGGNTPPPPNGDKESNQSEVIVVVNEQNQAKDGGETKKKAYVIKDETLPSVPEDSTLDSISSDFTTSSYESDGKIIMKTTKRHLPDDPKLLRLQHKIMKQKEKYKQERLRELRRKEKIIRLERVLAEQNLAARRNAKMHSGKDPDQQATKASSVPKKTSTPSSRRQMVQDSSTDSTMVTVSDISSSTITPRSTVSEYQTEARDTSAESAQPIVTCQSHVMLGACTCQSQDGTQIKVIQNKRKHFVSTCSGFGQDNIQLQLSYMHGHSPSGGIYMEFDKPGPRPQIKSRSMSKASERDKENAYQTQQKKVQVKHKNIEQKVHKKVSANMALTQAINQDFGQTFPSPRVTVQSDDAVSKVSRAVQTQSSPADVTDSKSDASTQKKDDKMATARKCYISKVRKRGPAWFIPLERPTPLRKPLREWQDHTIKRDFWSEEKPSDNSLDRVSSNSDYHLSALRPSAKGGKLSLQEAFLAHKQDFISRSHERQRLINLRATERRIQDLHRMQREQLFAVRKKLHTNAHPLGELHFKPQKRRFTRKQMIEQTKKLYGKLPEVKRKIEDEKKMKYYQTNRLRAKLYKQRILNQVLSKEPHWFS